MPTLSCAVLTAGYFTQKEMFKDSARNAEYIAEVNVMKAITANQTANITYLEDSKKKKTARIFWNKFCDTTTSTTDPDFCVITGPEADAECKDYAITRQVSKTFTVDEALYENSNLSAAEVIADLMMKTKKALDEKIASVSVAVIDGFTSPNLYTQKGIGCPGVVGPPENWASTYIPPALWTPELMHYFLDVKRINKFTAPFLLDGKNLSATAWKAMMNAGNANGSGADKMIGVLPYYEDLVNVQAVSPNKTFMIDRGVLALANRARWTGNNATNPIQEKERWKYSEASDNIPGITYDVYVTEVCSGPYTKLNFLVHTTWDLFNAPTNCYGSNGILEFVCGPCPTV